MKLQTEPALSLKLKVGTRGSPLAHAQVHEIITQFKDQLIDFEKVLIRTTGDLDQQTCLKTEEKTNFFTKQIDDAVLNHVIDIAIHSAKDLPETLPEGLEIFAITRGVDSSDALVLKYPLKKLRNPIFGTSSLRREEVLKQLFPSCKTQSIRGAIHQRLELLDHLDGVVIAEAALIRLKLTYLYRVTLPGPSACLQGKLAIVGRKEDHHLKHLFAFLNDQTSALSGVKVS